MDLRTPGSQINEARAKDTATSIVSNYWEKPDSITAFEPDSRGQIQLVLNDILFNFTPDEAKQVGLRMELKDTGAVNDMTILVELVSGQPVYEFSDFGDAQDYEYIRKVLNEMVVELKARMRYAVGADNYTRGRDEIIKD